MSARNEVLSYVERGMIAPELARPALQCVGALPGAADWRRFVDRLLLWIGTTMLAAALVYFLAYNWDALGRFAKLGLAQIAIIAALGFAWRIGLERVSGKAALLAASIFTGALLALIGQIYQTGADTFELFAAWAVAILPWVLVARFAGLWLLWLTIVNLAVVLYFDAFRGAFGIVFGAQEQLWLLFAVNTAALAAMESARAAGVPWLRQRWSLDIVATASGAMATALAVMAIFELRWRPVSAFAIPAWIAWLVAAYALYRHRVRDVFVLAGGALSLLVVCTAFLIKHVLGHAPGTYLFVALVVIGLTAAFGWWLTAIAREEA